MEENCATLFNSKHSVILLKISLVLFKGRMILTMKSAQIGSNHNNAKLAKFSAIQYAHTTNAVAQYSLSHQGTH